MNNHMNDHEQKAADPQNEYQLRKEKVAQLEASGINPYPADTTRTATVQVFLDAFDTNNDTPAVLAGRLRLKREHGKIAFCQLEDASGRVQIVLSAEELGSDTFKEALNMIDVGDFVEVNGKAFLTQKGEPSLLVSELRMLSKSVRPLPDKWKGLQDDELRLRKRYLDLLTNPDLRELFVRKTRFWNAVRHFLSSRGFLEVETPILENTPGGADAAPFITHHNALDLDVYLRISMGELWQKRLMVAGFEKTFEIGRQFRNEGMSPEHLQDYTQMEFYWAYANYENGMELCEEMYKHVINEAFGTLQFHIRGFDVNLDTRWEHLDYAAAVERAMGINVLDASDEELREACIKNNISIEENAGRGRMIDSLWKQVRKTIAGPVFLVNHPVEVSPLAKRRPQDPRTVERFQIVFAGSELGNGYSELNDPLDQAERFAEQARLREDGDAEAQMHDADFVEALEYGMPPTCGFGFSERLFSFLEDKPIRECVLFPLMRPENHVEYSTGPDNTLNEFEVGMSREDAKNLVFEHVKDEALRRHMLATEVQMRKIAKHFGAKSPESWAIAGLLHDVDYEKCTAERHSLDGADMLSELDIHEDVVNAVREHNQRHGILPQTIMSKALAALEQLTGLVTACVYVRPDKSIHSLELKSVKKKFKDKSFAKGVDRTNAAFCEEWLGITIDEALQLTLDAMKEAADELGLAGEPII